MERVFYVGKNSKNADNKLVKSLIIYYNFIMLSKWYAYCLELKDGYHYIGISQRPAARIFAHKNKAGSRLTQKHDVKGIVGIWCIGIMDVSDAMEIEKNFTQCFASVFDDKVRGGGMAQEDWGYTPNPLGWKYINRFENVTIEVKEELEKIEARGWC